MGTSNDFDNLKPIYKESYPKKKKKKDNLESLLGNFKKLKKKKSPKK
jgi:hypothetical protein